MHIHHTHAWNVTPAEALQVQHDLCALVVTQNQLGAVQTIAGVDVGFEGDQARAAIVLLEFPSLTPLEQSVAQLPVTFPYIPGLLAFREGPAILAALEKLSREPDLLLLDGQGRAHPRRLGIASHIGVILDKPSIGCAKSILVGGHAPLDDAAGSWGPLLDKGEIVGAALRTRPGVTPVYVSIGHRVDLDTAIQIVMGCCRGYRLPEPTRLAHQVAGGAQVVATPSQLSLF